MVMDRRMKNSIRRNLPHRLYLRKDLFRNWKTVVNIDIVIRRRPLLTKQKPKAHQNSHRIKVASEYLFGSIMTQAQGSRRTVPNQIVTMRIADLRDLQRQRIIKRCKITSKIWQTKINWDLPTIQNNYIVPILISTLEMTTQIRHYRCSIEWCR